MWSSFGFSWIFVDVLENVFRPIIEGVLNFDDKSRVILPPNFEL